MSPIIFAFPVFLASIMLEAWLRWRRGLPGYDIPDALTSLHAGALSQVAGVIVRLLGFGVYALVFKEFALVTWPTDNPALWVLALLIYDHFYYWSHRLGHEVGLFWASHVIHHSSEHFNLSTALRQSSTGGIVPTLLSMPLAILGVPPMMFAIIALIDLLYQYWVHTELVGRLGWAEKIFVTPSNHRVHHGQNDYCIDKNYGGVFIIWDRIYGTYEDERPDEKVVYGVRKPVGSLNPLWINLHHFADLAGQMRRTPGWRQKIQVLLAPPGGWHHEDVQPFEPATFSRFDRQTPADVKRYAMAHYVALVLMLAHFLMVQAGLSVEMRLLYAGIILGSAVTVGGLLDGARWAFGLEAARLVAVIAAIIVWPVWFTLATPMVVRVLMVIGLAWSLLWSLAGALRSLRADPARAAIPAE